MPKKTTANGGGNVALMGATLAGIAATAYFFLGPKGKKHQKQAKAWAIKMKGEVVEKLERAREVSEPIYHQIIDTVAAKYGEEKDANRNEIRELTEDLKKHWKTLSGKAGAVKHKVVRGAKKATAKVTKE
ncbi:MAG: hypothetical protein AAB407_03740 [Patescibacteria group bacterium]